MNNQGSLNRLYNISNVTTVAQELSINANKQKQIFNNHRAIHLTRRLCLFVHSTHGYRGSVHVNAHYACFYILFSWQQQSLPT